MLHFIAHNFFALCYCVVTKIRNTKNRDPRKKLILCYFKSSQKLKGNNKRIQEKLVSSTGY